jgi:rare lipoprotein A
VIALLARCHQRTFRRFSGAAWCNCKRQFGVERQIVRIVPGRRPELFLEISEGTPQSRELLHAENISVTKRAAGTMLGTTMLSLDKPLLTSFVAALAFITMNAANAEVASVYGGSDGLCGSRTANGERVNCSAMTAAHRTLPFGSQVTICHHGCVVVRINDRGPFVPGRDIDLTPAAARAIGLTEIGHVSLSR